MSINWEDIEKALCAWVRTGSGLSTQKVIRADQTGNRPDRPFITVRVGDLLPVGAVDSADWEFDEDADPGAEIVESVRGQREFSVEIQAFSAAALGANQAREYLSKVQTALGLSSVRTALHAVGITPFDLGRITSVPAILDTTWEGRAILTVRFYAEEQVTATTTYIGTVEVTNEEPDPDQTFTVTIEEE